MLMVIRSKNGRQDGSLRHCAGSLRLVGGALRNHCRVASRGKQRVGMPVGMPVFGSLGL